MANTETSCAVLWGFEPFDFGSNGWCYNLHKISWTAQCRFKENISKYGAISTSPFFYPWICSSYLEVK
ncbi:hypothetical protein NQ314_013549 [Rhamnusium bicolor]|uniref:Uncharacterized protein n=1 Tax=Rhamnusium bicolor TaxID=1586634 RepID=A0AAV8X591_9CUCU|nr:hypothetical protein NQ314_013549 [Rhamnusium bicolor]